MNTFKMMLSSLLVTQALGVIQFSEHVQDHMVLQRSPQKASVFGTVNSTATPTITVTVKGGDEYTVEGKVVGSQWVAYLKPTPAGGKYSITASCTSGCTPGDNEITISDVTFGDVWYCGGQSNMALPLTHTISRNISEAAIKGGKYSNIRIHQMNSNMNPTTPWMTLLNATQQDLFFTFSATCYYFGESLTDFMGDTAPPLGLIHTAFGGSTAEQWTSNKTSSQCRNVTQNGSSQEWFDQRVVPFANMTLKGFLWYQGENDMGELFGNSERAMGYACEVPAMIAEWRELFSQEPGTTDPNAPFGLVTLAPSGAEGHPDMGAMYIAQMGSYGDVPNPAMPNTFLAHAYDIGDPFGNITCYKNKCCPPNNVGTKCHGCEAYCNSSAGTGFYMGPIHPRDKKPLGIRLAQASYGSVYGGDVAVRGPVISGCSVVGDKLTITFNSTLLGKDTVAVTDYQRQNKASSLQVLTNSSLFCMQSLKSNGKGPTTCIDNGEGKEVMIDGDVESLKTWPMVNVDVATSNSVVADISGMGEIFAVRYAFWAKQNHGCCGLNDPTSGPCPLASCPLKSSSGLPANPFIAHIVNGKCKCLPPQVCDE